jgi:hypothetical protein
MQAVRWWRRFEPSNLIRQARVTCQFDAGGQVVAAL